jgi:dCTP deaminase
MRLFFMEHFFGGTASEADNFRRKYDKMVRYVQEIGPDQLRNIQLSISEGLPVPSKPSRSGVWLAEEPTSIQEVLLAAWLDRLERLLPEGLKITSGPTADSLNREDLLRPFLKFDNAVLQSLQIAEWLHVLIDTTPSPRAASFAKDCARACDERAASEHLISDIGIATLLGRGDLRIVPLVDLEQQLGAASFDIRLGTSFEVYLPAYVRQGSSVYASPDAYTPRSVDLDFLQHIVLLPGEMVLAHSFEYVRLPDSIAAELDGRSSYARLGLEIHLTAGMIDPGFEGTITFEMVNNGPNPIPLFPGLRIGQLRFLRVQRPMRPYSKRRNAKYGRQLHHSRSLYTSDVDYQRLLSAIGEQEDVARGVPTKTSAPSDFDEGGR